MPFYSMNNTSLLSITVTTRTVVVRGYSVPVCLLVYKFVLMYIQIGVVTCMQCMIMV